MKNISSVVRNFLASGNHTGFILVTIYANTTLRYTTLPYSVNIGGNTFDADNNLVSVDPPKVAVSTDKASYRVVFTDPEYSYAALGDSLLNSKVVIEAGFINTSGASVILNSGTYHVDEPILDTAALFKMYSGKVEKTSYVVSDDDGILFVIDCGSPMINMDTVNAFYTTKDAILQRSGTSVDTAFDYVSVSGIRRAIQWGKV